MEKTPSCESLDPITKPTIIATKITTCRTYAMEINPNLWKFKACNKNHNYNRVVQWKKTPTCESLDLAIKTTTMAIETTSKNCAMKKTLTCESSKLATNITTSRGCAMEETPIYESLDLAIENTTIATKTIASKSSTMEKNLILWKLKACDKSHNNFNRNHNVVGDVFFNWWRPHIDSDVRLQRSLKQNAKSLTIKRPWK